MRGAIVNFADALTTPAKLQGNMEVSGEREIGRTPPDRGPAPILPWLGSKDHLCHLLTRLGPHPRLQ